MDGRGLLKQRIVILPHCCRLNNIVLVNTVNVKVQKRLNRFGKILTVQVQVAVVVQEKI